MVTEKKFDIPKFQLYKSEITHKFYVKYPDQPEKEITKWEYNSLQLEKDRALENKMNESVNFAQADKLKVKEKFHNSFVELDVIFYEHPTVAQATSFECGTCYGECYWTKDSLVIDSIFNSQKGNGDFRKTISTLRLYCLLNKLSLSLTNVCQQLIDFIKKEYTASMTFQVTKNTIIIL